MTDTITNDLGLEDAGFIRERVVASELELRGDGRTLYGLVVPFDTVATVNDGRGNYGEMFKRGSFTRTIAGNAGQRVKLMANHDAKRFPVGKATMLREDPAGLVGEFHVSSTRDGDEVVQLTRDGVLDSFSVGFQPIKHTRNTDGVVERREVALREVSVVAFPAYASALIGGIRADQAAAAHHLLELLREDPGSLSESERSEILTLLDTSRSGTSSATSGPADSGTSGVAADTSNQTPAGPTKDQCDRRASKLRKVTIPGRIEP